jgi:putative pyrroloquinoline-quinone binding quinoprotein/putative pyrroloquinoline-quinone-binding quinoprotein
MTRLGRACRPAIGGPLAVFGRISGFRVCSAVALIALCFIKAAAQPPAPSPFPASQTRKSKTDRTPLSFFPIRTVWTLALNSPLAMPPAYDATNAYFALDGDRIVSYDVISGMQKWIESARPQMEPVAGDDLLFVVEPDKLRALQAGDGGVAWELPFTEKLVARPVWDNGWLVAATAGGSILAFRATDGDLVWSRDIGSPAHARPSLAADRIYIPTQDGRIVALRIDTGATAWERRLGGAADEILAFDDRLFVGTRDNFFSSLMARDGRVDWRWRTGGDVVGLPAADDRHVFFVALDNVMRAMDRKSGAQHWMRPLPMRPTAGPVRAVETLVVAGIGPTLRAYNLSDGTSAGEVPAGADVTAAPHVFLDPINKLPLLLFVTQDIAKGGASAKLVTRSFDPPITPIAPLPNLITVSLTMDPK